LSKKRGIVNKQVKKLFNGLGFDQGVALLDEELLVELLLFINQKPKNFQKEELLRTIRSFWSEANINLRKAILHFIASRMQQEDLSIDLAKRVEKIESIARNLTQDKEEIAQIIESFKEHKSKKITEKKIKNKLNQIRFFAMQQTLYEQTLVKVTYEGSGSFTQTFRFELFGETFHKELLVQTKPIENFLDLNDEEKVFNIFKHKDQAALEKQKQINAIIDNIPKDHPYLSNADITLTLKSLQFDDDLDAPPVTLNILRKIFKEYIVIEEQSQIVLQKQMYCVVLDTPVHYNASLKFEKKALYADIFYAQPIDVEAVFKEQNIQNLAKLKLEIDSLKDEMQHFAKELAIDEATIESYVKNHVLKELDQRKSLEIRSKTVRRVMYHYQEHLTRQKQKLYKEELLKKTVRDFKNLFPVARNLNRKLIFHVGPTNSGKTYAAMQALKNSHSGYYLAPLRLLALEGYEDLQKSGIDCSLITGEEEIFSEESTHVCSTIEMLNFGFDVDCCVIDEIQMIADKDRGWAWVNAIIGAPAKTVYLTGSHNALAAVKEIASWLDETLEVVHFERKNPLKMLDKPVSLENITPQTALIAFSRKEVLALKQRLSNKFSISVVYGNLSPEVRREEARRFREGESQVLIATDAISMGLNLPIKTILFSKETKFDGEVMRELKSDEVLQISGRAGRYGIEEVGYVGGINAKIHKLVASKLQGSLTPIKAPFTVMANLEHVNLVAQILQTDKLYDVLDFFANNMKFEGPFVAKRLEQMMEIAHITDSYELPLQMKYYLSCAPVSINSPYIESKFHEYILCLEKNAKVDYVPIRNLPSHANSAAMLLKIEDRVKEISLYLWLSFKFPELFTDTQKATQARMMLNSFIENSLKFSQFIKRCKRCGAPLDFDFKYKVCDRCFHRNKRK
jgi:ATP-dependent RNA helicase SUPV3L1/SUV3